MANVDTIQRQVQGITAKDLAALALGTSTSETSFSKSSLTVGITTIMPAVPATIQVPAQNQNLMYWDLGRPFLYTAWGTCVTGTSANLTLKLYQVPASVVSGASLASGSVSGLNVIATSTARAVNSTTGKFFFSAQLQWDSVSKLIHGYFTDEISNLLDGNAATTAVTTATAFDTELNFILSATLSAGNAANVVNLMEQTIQAI